MRLVQFSTPDAAVRLGMIEGDTVVDITAGAAGLGSVLNALERAERQNEELEQTVRANAKPGKRYSFAELDVSPEPGKPHLLLPIFAPEVWGCGVTYKRSAEAREDEVKGQGGFYDMAHRAERPEIFFKASAARCSGPNGPMGMRKDSHYTAPEPEFALLLDSTGHIHGYTCANDVSASDIERENPLYLPQSKTFARCCCLGPCIVTNEDLPNPKNIKVTCTITRGKKVLFSGETNTSRMKRELGELIEYLTRCNPIPTGTVLMTGTGVVMPEEVKLEPGDCVTITMDRIGTLRNFAELV